MCLLALAVVVVEFGEVRVHESRDRVAGRWTLPLVGPSETEFGDVMRVEELQVGTVDVEGEKVTLTGRRSTSRTIIEYDPPLTLRELALPTITVDGKTLLSLGSRTGPSTVGVAFPGTAFGRPVTVFLGPFATPGEPPDAMVLAVGDGALGFWAAVRTVFPETREQRCWFHKIANVLNVLPKSAQPGAKAALAEIWNAEDKDHARAAVKVFVADYGTKWPKAAAKITEDLDVLLAFYDYPAEHWVHLRTTNPIESTFATVRLRQRVTKGPGSRTAGVAMAFKLIESAQARWRAVNAPHLVALVRAGATFKNGILVERDDEPSHESGSDQQAA